MGYQHVCHLVLPSKQKTSTSNNLVSLQSRLDTPEGRNEGDHHVEAGTGDALQQGTASVVDPDMALLDLVKGLQRKKKHR